MNVEFVLSKDYSPRQGSPAQIDLIQLGAPDNPDKIVGGQRFTLDLSKLVLVKSGDQWRYWDNGKNPGRAWTSFWTTTIPDGSAAQGHWGPETVRLPRSTSGLPIAAPLRRISAVRSTSQIPASTETRCSD